MSVKYVPKHQKSKKNSYFHSQRKEDQFDESLSSHSSHTEQLSNEISRLHLDLKNASQRRMQYREMMDKFMGFDDQLSKEEAKVAEGQFQLWHSRSIKIMEKIKAVNHKLRQIYDFRQKHQKKRNYVLKKVQEPPSDNE